MSKKILLLHVPYGELYANLDIKKLGWGVPPLGLAALSTFIKQKTDCSVKLVDMLFESIGITDIPNLLKDFSPDIVGLSATTPQMDNAYLTAKVIKEFNSSIKIVIGGPHASALPERTLKECSCIDYAVVGEGELPLLSLVNNIHPDSIKSLVWRKDNNIIVNEREALIEDLSTLPFPDYDSLPLKSYGTFYGGHSIGIMSGRGCHYNCSFCASRVTHLGKYRFRPMDLFLNDINRLLKLGVPKFDIWDDTFTSSKKRVYEFIEGYKKKGFTAHWSCQTRADCLDKQLLSEMHKSGMDIIHVGCESGNQDILDKIGKKIRLEQVENVCRWAKEIGITVYVYFIVGLPYETRETIMDTINFAKKLPIDLVQFSMLVPLPGTRIWDLAEEGKVLQNKSKRWSDYDRYNTAIVNLEKISSDEITKLYKYAMRSFYLRGSYILSTLGKINNLDKLKMYLRMFSAFLKLQKGKKKL